MRFDGGLKNGGLILSFLIISLFIFLPSKVFAVGEPCWKDYPTGGTPIAGFPKAADFTLPGICGPAAACSASGKVVGPTGFGCGGTDICCLVPAKSLGACYNDYVGDDRTSFQSTSCVKSDAQCASPNKKLGDGHGCSDANGGTICCAIIDKNKAAGYPTGGALPQTGSTAEWKYNNKEGTGLQLVECTKDGNCTIDDLVQQGVNFAKWVMGLAGALFLLVFVYGGAMYAVSFGRSDYITKGKNAMTRGAFGIILVMGAWTIVSYVSTSLGYKGVSLGGTTQTDQTATCANDANSFRGCVTESAKCVDWCKQVYGASTSGDVDVSKNCADGPANSCPKSQKCCVLNR